MLKWRIACSSDILFLNTGKTELSENSSLMPKLMPVDRNDQKTQKTVRIDNTRVPLQLQMELPKSVFTDNKQINDINQKQPPHKSKLQNHKKFKNDKRRRWKRKKRGKHNKQFKRKQSVYKEEDDNNKVHHQENNYIEGENLEKKQHRKIEPLGKSHYTCSYHFTMNCNTMIVNITFYLYSCEQR